MLVVIANDLPPAVRGRMKLWFIEPKPNVFVSGMKDAVAIKITEYLIAHCPAESGVIIFRSLPVAPGYRMHIIGSTKKAQIDLSGLQLVIETLISP